MKRFEGAGKQIAYFCARFDKKDLNFLRRMVLIVALETVDGGY